MGWGGRGHSTRGERSRSSTHNDGAVIPPPRRYLARPPRSGPVLPAPEPARPFVVSCFCCRAATRPQIQKQPPVCRVSSSLRTEAPCESITLRRSNTLPGKIFASGTYTLRRSGAGGGVHKQLAPNVLIHGASRGSRWERGRKTQLNQRRSGKSVELLNRPGRPLTSVKTFHSSSKR